MSYNPQASEQSGSCMHIKDDRDRFVVHSDEKLSAFLELERITHELALSPLLGDEMGSLNLAGSLRLRWFVRSSIAAICLDMVARFFQNSASDQTDRNQAENSSLARFFVFSGPAINRNTSGEKTKEEPYEYTHSPIQKDNSTMSRCVCAWLLRAPSASD